MTTPRRSDRPTILALKVRQWLREWEQVKWDPEERRRKPKPDFYLFTMSAPQLRRLCGIRRRSPEERTRAAEDLGIQRRHDPSRSDEIARFIRYGYPWSDLSEAKRASDDFSDLRKPGWLPTAIVVNILSDKDGGRKDEVDNADLVTVSSETPETARVSLPAGSEKPRWKPKGGYPIEVIDGQHRLWAFDEPELDGDFQLPVVAFVGLDLSWQAYLFYTINIKPKRINASLAYDLYPLLRTEEWLDRLEGHPVYRETRAQELVDLLYSHPESPWHRWINMLGDRGRRPRMVSQAAWVRSLLAAYVKPWGGRGVRVGGLFGSRVGEDEQILPWSRFQQAAFLIVLGQELRRAIEDTNASWAEDLRRRTPPEEAGQDAAFYGDHSLLNQDQGIRAVLHVTNDLCHKAADQLGLHSWAGVVVRQGSDEAQVSSMVASLRKQVRIRRFLKDLSAVLASYDWRASKAPGLTTQQSREKARFRGSGGYGELRRDVLIHLSQTKWKYAGVATETLEIIE
jgi:DGQHR domain-containing protein